MLRSITLIATLCLAPLVALAQAGNAPLEGRLKKIHETKTISVAYRTDALPFSFEDSEKKPAGYTVDLCRSVVGVIERQLGVTPLQVKWVPVTVADPLHRRQQRPGRHGVRRQHGDAGADEGSGLLVADLRRRHRPAGAQLDRRQFADGPGRQEDRRHHRHQQRAGAGRGHEGQDGRRPPSCR